MSRPCFIVPIAEGSVGGGGEGPVGEGLDEGVDGEISSGTDGGVLVDHAMGEDARERHIKTPHEDVGEFGGGVELCLGGPRVLEVADETDGDGIGGVGGMIKMGGVQLAPPTIGDLDESVGGAVAVADDEVVFDAVGVSEGLSVVAVEGGGTTGGGSGMMDDDGLPLAEGVDAEEDVVSELRETTRKRLIRGGTGLGKERLPGVDGVDAGMRRRAEEDEETNRCKDTHTHRASEHIGSR